MLVCDIILITTSLLGGAHSSGLISPAGGGEDEDEEGEQAAAKGKEREGEEREGREGGEGEDGGREHCRRCPTANGSLRSRPAAPQPSPALLPATTPTTVDRPWVPHAPSLGL